MDPTLHGTRGAGVLSLKLSQRRARPPRTGWSYSVVATSVHPDHPARDWVSRTPATVSSTTTAAALHPKDNQQLPTDLPKRASYPPAYLQQANAPATKRG